MTADFRALCIELTDCLEKADWPLRHRYVFRQWIDIARAALADEPAVPEGREPVAVTGQPSDDELLRLYGVATPCHTVHEWERELNFARAVLTRWGNPAPQPPAEGEVEELVVELQMMASQVAEACQFTDAENLTRAAELLQRQVLVPVSVSERLPGPEDCDAEGRCWWGEPQIEDSHDATWNLCTQDDAQEFLTWGTKCGWLSAHALPIPQQQENTND